MKLLKKITFEMIPVVLGILIALFINDWKQNRENERFMRSVLASIEKEMQLNVEEFSRTIPKQYALVDTLEVYMDNEKISLTEIFQKAKGFQVPAVKNTSWKSFLSSRMELVNFEVFSHLTDIEELKGFMSRKLDYLMDFVLDNVDSTEPRIKKSLIIQLLNLLDSEEQLLDSYKAYLEIESKDSRQ